MATHFHYEFSLLTACCIIVLDGVVASCSHTHKAADVTSNFQPFFSVRQTDVAFANR